MAKGNNAESGSNKFVTLKVYSKRRMVNLFLAFIVLLSMSALIAFNAIKLQHSHNIEIIFTGLVLGILLCLLPLSEEWNYSPWQDAPRKLEQDIRD